MKNVILGPIFHGFSLTGYKSLNRRYVFTQLCLVLDKNNQKKLIIFQNLFPTALLHHQS